MKCMNFCAYYIGQDVILFRVVLIESSYTLERHKKFKNHFQKLFSVRSFSNYMPRFFLINILREYERDTLFF